MSWLNKIKGWFGSEKQLEIRAHPISATITPKSSAVMKRHAGRLCRLIWLKEDKRATPEMLAEIDRLGYLLASEGNPLPKTLEEAEALYKRVGG